jgi:hypothetical protein
VTSRAGDARAVDERHQKEADGEQAAETTSGAMRSSNASGGDAEGIHQMRVAVRRWRATLPAEAAVSVISCGKRNPLKVASYMIGIKMADDEGRKSIRRFQREIRPGQPIQLTDAVEAVDR